MDSGRPQTRQNPVLKGRSLQRAVRLGAVTKGCRGEKGRKTSEDNGWKEPGTRQRRGGRVCGTEG